jgi:hypothetical protein
MEQIPIVKRHTTGTNTNFEVKIGFAVISKLLFTYMSIGQWNAYKVKEIFPK